MKTFKKVPKSAVRVSKRFYTGNPIKKRNISINNILAKNNLDVQNSFNVTRKERAARYDLRKMFDLLHGKIPKNEKKFSNHYVIPLLKKKFERLSTPTPHLGEKIIEIAILTFCHGELDVNVTIDSSTDIQKEANLSFDPSLDTDSFNKRIELYDNDNGNIVDVEYRMVNIPDNLNVTFSNAGSCTGLSTFKSENWIIKKEDIVSSESKRMTRGEKSTGCDYNYNYTLCASDYLPNESISFTETYKPKKCFQILRTSAAPTKTLLNKTYQSFNSETLIGTTESRFSSGKIIMLVATQTGSCVKVTKIPLLGSEIDMSLFSNLGVDEIVMDYKRSVGHLAGENGGSQTNIQDIIAFLHRFASFCQIRGLCDEPLKVHFIDTSCNGIIVNNDSNTMWENFPYLQTIMKMLDERFRSEAMFG